MLFHCVESLVFKLVQKFSSSFMQKLFLLLALTFAVSLSKAQTHNLQPFETDGCTFFVDGPVGRPNLWKHCCFEHDLRYWFGGDISARDVADDYLRQCVQASAGSFWANLMYKAVKRGHHSPIQHRLHWGWAWTPERANTPLTPSEKATVRQELYLLNLDRPYVESFILKYRLN